MTDDSDTYAEAEAPFTRSDIESQVTNGMDLLQDAYMQKSLGGIKVFLLTVSVVTLLSDFKDGLVVGLIAWGLTALFNWWRWKRAIEAYGKCVTENAKQVGIESFDFLNAAHYRRGKELLTLFHRR
ncbi:MAG: hypothetical protein WBL50_10670 [Candidatus Acidiferrum sp.]